MKNTGSVLHQGKYTDGSSVVERSVVVVIKPEWSLVRFEVKTPPGHECVSERSKETDLRSVVHTYSRVRIPSHSKTWWCCFICVCLGLRGASTIDIEINI